MICRGRGSFASLFGHFCTQEGPLLGSMWYTNVSIKRMICRSKTYEEDPPLWSSPSICFIWPKSGVSGCIGQSKLLLCDQYALREAWEALLCQLVSHLLFYCNIYRCQSSPTLHIELQCLMTMVGSTTLWRWNAFPLKTILKSALYESFLPLTMPWELRTLIWWATSTWTPPTLQHSYPAVHMDTSKHLCSSVLRQNMATVVAKLNWILCHYKLICHKRRSTEVFCSERWKGSHNV